MIQPFTVDVPHNRYSEFFAPTLEGDELLSKVWSWLDQHVGDEWLGGWLQMMNHAEPAWRVTHFYDNSLTFIFNRVDRAVLFKLTWL